VRDIFREWLMANFPDRHRHVFKLIFNSCGVGMSCKSLILHDTRAGFLKSVVPRCVAKRLMNVP
jgi:hypothetical protein